MARFRLTSKVKAHLVYIIEADTEQEAYDKWEKGEIDTSLGELEMDEDSVEEFDEIEALPVRFSEVRDQLVLPCLCDGLCTFAGEAAGE